jgi:hypothetical protein
LPNAAAPAAPGVAETESVERASVLGTCEAKKAQNSTRATLAMGRNDARLFPSLLIVAISLVLSSTAPHLLLLLVAIFQLAAAAAAAAAPL